MAILSDDQVARIRRNSKQHNERAGAERLRGLVEAAARVDWGDCLKQRLAEFYAMSIERGLPWALDFEHAMALMASPCHYCGILEPGRFNGLDRVDNAIGYTLENAVACCRWCNRAKGRNSVEEFTAWLEWVKGSKVREYLGSTGLAA